MVVAFRGKGVDEDVVDDCVELVVRVGSEFFECGVDRGEVGDVHDAGVALECPQVREFL